MRQWVLIVGVSVAVGIGIAYLVNGLAPKSNAQPAEATCADLAPTAAVIDGGRKIVFGLQAPRTPDTLPCTVLPSASRVVEIDVTSAAGRRILHFVRPNGGPPPGTHVVKTLGLSHAVAALAYCSAKQPLTIKVSGYGLGAVGTLSLRRVGDHCQVA